MTAYYTLDGANARIPDLRETLLVLRDQRRELVRLRDRYLELTGHPLELGAGLADRGGSREGLPGGEATTITGLEEARLVELRVRGIVDQMGASVARLDADAIALRDIETGLVDLPALVSGRPVWLCWRLGERDAIEFWHEYDAGFAGRRTLAELA